MKEGIRDSALGVRGDHSSLSAFQKEGRGEALTSPSPFRKEGRGEDLTSPSPFQGEGWGEGKHRNEGL